jgi:O-antigen/teichoic acid export membrane protein
MGYKASAISGISWMSAFRVSTRAVTFLKTAVIARALNPSQFGLFGIASLVLSLLEMLTETGINIIIIQSERKIDEYINSAWVVSIIRGIAIALIIIITAPLVSRFFNLNDSLNLLLFISLVPFIRGFINPAIIQLQKDLQFNKEFIFRLVIFLFDAAVSIIFVTVTHSVYSLVFGLLAGAILEVILSFVLIKPTPVFRLEKEYFNEIFHKGKWVTTYGIFNYFAQEGDNITVGRVLGAASLGTYQMAYKISTLPISEVTDVVSKVVFPVYVKIAGDRERLWKAFKQSTIIISLLTTFLGLMIFFFSEEIVSILLGEKWIQAVPVLRILSIYGILRAIFGSVSTIFLATGNQRYVTTMTFVRFIILAITIYPMVRMYGIVGAGYSAMLSVLFEIPVIVYYTNIIFKRK